MTQSTRRALSWAIPIMALLGFVAFLLQGADRPPNPSFRTVQSGDGSSDTTASARQRVGGFGEITYRVDATGVLFGGGSVSAARCALLAETAVQQSQGLMGRTDLSGYDGMLFVFEDDTRSAFFMKDTLIPLSIAWFDSDGGFVSAADMPPCGDEPVCPTYGPDADYRYALEVLEGGLPALGIGPGTRLLIGDKTC